MSETTGDTGPDLEQGILSAELAEGAMVAGTFRGEAVLLARVGGEVHAIGGKCSHYGVPLAGGLITGGLVRCPAHHACFDLRTGRSRAAPGLGDLACFAAEERSGKLRVLGKTEPGPLPAVEAGPGVENVVAPGVVVIAGAGAAGHAAATELSRRGFAGKVILLGDEEPLDRPNLSKDWLAGQAPEEWLPLADPPGVERRTARVRGIDRAGRRLLLEDGAALGYDALILAPGAEPVLLPVPGGDRSGVHYLRTLADARRIAAAGSSGASVVLIGAGFIGLEAAAALRARGASVTVVAPEEIPLQRVLGKELGSFLRAAHERAGVVFRLGATVAGVEEGAVILGSGERLPASLILAGIGVRPRTALAEAAGLPVDRGILVDAQLRTADPAIWAVGDAARWPDPRAGSIRVEHWVVAQRQGQAAARNVLGAAEPFTSVPFFWTTQHGVTVRYVGHAPAWDRIDRSGDLASSARFAYRTGGRTLAVATVGDDRAALEAEVALERGDEAELQRLVPPG